MNFRSRREILSAVNFIFEKIMSKDMGEVEYTSDAMLNAGTQFMDVEGPCVDVEIVRKDSQEEIDEELEEMSAIEVEARIAAQKIKSLIGKKTYDPKKGEYRQTEYKDIVILLRTIKNWAPSFMQVLREEGIPVYSDDSSGYFDVIEIQIFLNLLRIIDNKMQDIPMISVMRSPIGGFSVEDLINIRLSAKEDSYSSAVAGYDGEDGELSKKIDSFLESLERWTEDARILRLDEFIWKLLIETGYYYYVGAMPSGEQRQANLRILVDRASQFENSSINGLFNFIRFVDKLLRSSADMGGAKILGENENIVRIMSVHKSKGLEFPVVIMAGLGKKFNLRDSSSDILLHRELGMAPKYIDYKERVYKKTLPQKAIKKKMDIESLSEEMRILYVGMTRAVDRLVMMGSVKNIEGSSRKWCSPISPYTLSKSSSHMDWICSAISHHEDAGVIRSAAGVQIETSHAQARFGVRISDRNVINMKESSKSERVAEYKEILRNGENIQRPAEYDEIIKGRFSWKYDHEYAQKTPSKISVTQLAHASLKTMGYNIPSLVKRPVFMEEQRGFSAAEKGTILHFVMKNIEMKSECSEESIKCQLDEMVSKELINEEEKEVVDIRKIKLFMDSEIGMRMANSEKVFKEAPFVMKKNASQVIDEIDSSEDDILIQGVIDCYFYEDGEVVILDYKSDRIREGQENERALEYKGQLKLYKEAVEKITGKRVSNGYIYFFETANAVKII